MKLLFIGNVGYRFNTFVLSSSVAARELGIEFHVAGSWTGYDDPADKRADEEKYHVKIHQIDFVRSPYNPQNIKAYKQILELIRREKYDVIHCNTPIGGVVGRLAGKKCKIKPVIYQAHGFHFYKGAPALNWALYYPVEKWLAHYTDALITINTEDFERAKKFRLKKGGRVYYVPGVGIEINEHESAAEKRKQLRESIGVPQDAILLISVGDLNKNKNHRIIIEALKKTDNEKIHCIFCGEGPLLGQLTDLAKPMANRIRFLGYRQDIDDLLAASDIFVMPSLREGLSRSLMEAMAAGLPCIASKIRGNVDLIKDGESGYLCDARDSTGFSEAITKLANDQNLRKQFAANGRQSVMPFSLEAVVDSIKTIYENELY